MRAPPYRYHPTTITTVVFSYTPYGQKFCNVALHTFFDSATDFPPRTLKAETHGTIRFRHLTIRLCWFPLGTNEQARTFPSRLTYDPWAAFPRTTRSGYGVVCAICALKTQSLYYRPFSRFSENNSGKAAETVAPKKDIRIHLGANNLCLIFGCSVL